MKTFDQCKDEVAYRLYKTDYKYIGLAVCQVEVLEQAAELHAQEVAKDAWDRACDATLLKIKTTFTDPKNLDKCDNVAILLKDAVKEIGSDILSFPKPPYQPNQETK